MATSLIRSRAAITGTKDRFTWNEVKDGLSCRRMASSSRSAPMTT